MASRRGVHRSVAISAGAPVAATPVRWDQTNESSTIDELSRALPVLELLNPKTVLALAVAILARSVLGLGNEDRASFAFVQRCPPQLYGGTERVVSYLTEELVRQGHEVTLFASGDS